MNYKKITKQAARKLFNKGANIYILASKMNPNNVWMPPFMINNSNESELDKILNSYSYYNCNQETGNGINFYISD